MENKKIGLFDHLNQIRKTKNPDYYTSLEPDDEKTFNQYMILRFLSMDCNIIEETSMISKYLNIIPNDKFYTLCIKLLPKSTTFFKYIKSSKKKINVDLVDLIRRRYEISKKEAYNYAITLFSIENGIDEIVNICKCYGLTDKEIDKIKIYE